MRYWLILFLVLLVAGCSTAVATPEPVLFPDLPTAVPPSANATGGSWAISYSYPFPDNFWAEAEGTHRYAFNLTCPEDLSDLDFASPWSTFEVSARQAPQPETIYLRLQGLSLNGFMPNYLPEAIINPQQSTTAVVHYVGLQKEEAEQVIQNCEGFIAWDQAPPQALIPSEPFQP